MSVLLTIVVPAFNMEKYLRRCLDSLCVEEIMDRVQVIVVNDGSSDGTFKIAKEYEHKYPDYFQVIDKENGNYGSCMNRGLSLARGKYFRTLDADDWYDSMAYKEYVLDLDKTDADMLISERKVYYERKGDYEINSFPAGVIVNADISLSDMMENERSMMVFQTVNCISYKTIILKQLDFRWSEGVFYSDTEYDFFPLREVKSIRLMTYPVYCYYIGRDDQSISTASIRKNFSSLYTVSKRILDDFVLNAVNDTPQYPFQKYHLIRILRYLYQSLLVDGKKNIRGIEDIEALVKQNGDLERLTANMDDYRGYHYISLYRNSKFLFYLLRMDYILRTNRIIRRLFGKLPS